MFAVASTILLAIAGSAAAQATAVTTVTGPSPLTPPTADVGAPCVISWTPDTSGKWNQTNIELMTGDNQNMVHITTVTTVDTTTDAPTSFTWTCPDVTPNAPIYFYQFSHAAEPDNLMWTTRFTIAAADGSTTQPQYATQPNGQAIAWGIGALVDPSTAKPAPSYITGETSSTGATAGSVSVAPATSTGAASGATASPTPSMQIVTVVSTSTSATPSSASTATSGAVQAKFVGSAFALTGVAALLALLT